MAESRMLLSAVGMSVPLFVAGTSWTGIGITGTFTGTVNFSGSFDGINYNPLDVYPWPGTVASGGVQSAAATGKWYTPSLNYTTIIATLTALAAGAGPIVQMNASVDGSFRSAFMTAAQRFVNSFAYETANTIVIAADPNGAWRLRTLVISTDAVPTWASSPALKVLDGATLLWAGDPPLVAGTYLVPLPADSNPANAGGGGLVGTPSNSMTISLASSAGSSSSSASAAGGRTNIDAQISPA